jgi:hypothetical protein
MSKELPTIMIQQKIQELQTALFFPESSTLLNIPVHVVSSAQTDEEGHIWFVISRPAQYIDQDDSEFPCRLDFFKKGIGFHLKVQGKATLISQFSQVGCLTLAPDLEERMENNQLVAIKVKIQNAAYFEAPAAKSNSWVEDSRNQFINLFFKQGIVNNALAFFTKGLQVKKFLIGSEVNAPASFSI